MQPALPLPCTKMPCTLQHNYSLSTGPACATTHLPAHLPACPPACLVQAVRALVEQCLSADPDRRPSAAEVLKQLLDDARGGGAG